jgi:hypothetical protein
MRCQNVVRLVGTYCTFYDASLRYGCDLYVRGLNLIISTALLLCACAYNDVLDACAYNDVLDACSTSSLSVL